MKPHLSPRIHAARLLVFAFVGAVALLSGCSERKAGAPGDRVAGPAAALRAGDQATAIVQMHPGPPSGLATASVEGRSLTFWPYTGSSFETPSDPMNLIFVGDVDPVKIRAALLALDGDRTAFGIPAMAPFNERWADAHGSAQTAYAEAGGWTGSVIQLRLGEYGPLRVHLRLFRTEGAFGESGGWTLGGAHFELLIPGTAEHQVLSWMVARDIVTADLVRSGLLVAPPSMTAIISETPSFRAIPPEIYNPLPVELKGLIGGPLGAVSSPVPLASDGRAAVFHLESTPAPAPGAFTQEFTIPFGQLIPKPICSDGPYDYVYVEGPIDFSAAANVDEDGRYSMTSRYSGRLTITPMDVTQNPPVPSGAPFTALVSEAQQGQTGGSLDAIFSRTRMLGQERGGAEITTTELKVSSTGVQEFRLQYQCPEP